MDFWQKWVDDQPEKIALVLAADYAEEASQLAADSDLDSNDREYLGATLFLIQDVRARLEMNDPRLITKDMIVPIQAPAEALRDSLQRFLGEPTSEAISTIYKTAEVLLSSAYRLPPPPWQQDPNRIRIAMASFRGSLTQERLRMNKEVDSLIRKTGADMEKLSSRQESLDSYVSEVSQNIDSLRQSTTETATAFEQSAGESEERIRTVIGELEQARSNLDADYELGEATRNTQFSAGETHREYKFKSQFDKHNSEISELLDRAKNILGVSAATTTFAAADTEASRQAKAKLLWSLAGMAILIIAAVAGVVLFAYNAPRDPTIAGTIILLLSRLGVTGALGLAGVYAMREAGHHREREKEVRQLAIDIASFRPFLAELPQNEINEEIRHAAQRTFFRNISADADEAEVRVSN